MESASNQRCLSRFVDIWFWFFRVWVNSLQLQEKLSHPVRLAIYQQLNFVHARVVLPRGDFFKGMSLREREGTSFYNALARPFEYFGCEFAVRLHVMDPIIDDQFFGTGRRRRQGEAEFDLVAELQARC